MTYERTEAIALLVQAYAESLANYDNAELRDELQDVEYGAEVDG